MNTQMVHRWQSQKHAIRNNAEETRKLQTELNRLNSNSMSNMDKINEEMRFLKKQLMENRKVLGTRSDLQDLRADSGNRRREDNNEVNGNVGQTGHGQPRKEAGVDREEKNLFVRGEAAKATLLSLPNSSFRRERRLSSCRVLETLKEPQIDGSRNATPQSNYSTGTISSCSRSSRFSHDPSTGGSSLTKRSKVSLIRWSHDLDPRNQRRFSLPGHINPASQTSPVGKVPGSILNKASLPQSQNGVPKIVRKGKKSEDDIAKAQKAGEIRDKDSVLRVRRYSLPICNFHEQGNTATDSWFLTAKLPLGKYSPNDAVKARLSQPSSLGLINGKKTTCRAEYGKKPGKIRSPLIESTGNCGRTTKRNAGVPRELIQKAEDEEEEDDDDEDYRPSEDPQLRSIPEITLNEKIQRFFADYVEGAGKTGGVDFEQLLMECRIGKEETSEKEESSQTEGSEVESEKESQTSAE